MARKSNKSSSVSSRKNKAKRSKSRRKDKERLVIEGLLQGINDFPRDGKKLSGSLQGDGKESKYRKDDFDGIGDEISEKESLTFTQSVDKYLAYIKLMLVNEAIKKGYAEGNSLQANGRRSYDFIEDYVGEGHPLGEIIYKAMRYKRKNDPVDLIKIGAWAFLVWDKNQRGSK